MIANLLTPATHADKSLNGISRSRFSFHFNTAHKRRWLLVQLVTAPALPAADEADQSAAYVKNTSERNDYNHLINSFQTHSLAARCI